MMLELTPAEIEDICDTVLGYVDGELKIRQKYDQIEYIDLEEFLLDHNIERCPECNSFVESAELIDADGEPLGQCENCRKR